MVKEHPRSVLGLDTVGCQRVFRVILIFLAGNVDAQRVFPLRIQDLAEFAVLIVFLFLHVADHLHRIEFFQLTRRSAGTFHTDTEGNEKACQQQDQGKYFDFPDRIIRFCISPKFIHTCLL